MTDILEKVKEAIVEGDDEIAVTQIETALEEGIEPAKVLKEGIVPGIERAGELWHENVYFMPDVVLSAEAFKSAMNVIEPRLSELETKKHGTIMVGVVAGDMHDLGKSIVLAMLTGAGFKVIDIGVDIPAESFIEKIKEHNPDIIGIGCYMTTTMLCLKDVMKYLGENGLRDNVKVMIGGVPTTQHFADEIGADAWGRDALDAVDKAKKLMGV